MAGALVWISGASSGLGLALADSVPWEGAHTIGISRHPPTELQHQAEPRHERHPVEHLTADLADPASWATIGESFRSELEGFAGTDAVFVHAAATLEPIGFAGEVDTGTYAANVLLNSAAPQVLGHLFLAATARLGQVRRHLVMITSGAASSVYAGWSSYGAGKAAVDQWVRDAGAEQGLRGGVQVLAVAPGVVDTGMQARLRQTTEADFPARDKFIDLHAQNQLAHPAAVARTIWSLLDRGLPNGTVLDLRDLAAAPVT